MTVEGQNASLERAVEIKTTGMRQYAPEDDNSLLETQRSQRQSLAAGATETLRGVNAPWKHKDTVRRYRERYGALLRLQIRQTTREVQFHDYVGVATVRKFADGSYISEPQDDCGRPRALHRLSDKEQAERLLYE